MRKGRRNGDRDRVNSHKIGESERVKKRKLGDWVLLRGWIGLERWNLGGWLVGWVYSLARVLRCQARRSPTSVRATRLRFYAILLSLSFIRHRFSCSFPHSSLFASFLLQSIRRFLSTPMTAYSTHCVVNFNQENK